MAENTAENKTSLFSWSLLMSAGKPEFKSQLHQILPY